MGFKKDFIWGAASAAYQVEGAYDEDGKGRSIWDVYAASPCRVAHKENGNVACDHYHRFEEDIEIMKSLGIKYYRLSVSWTRILPNGTGKINQAGIDFYNRLFTALKTAGIEPMVTLFHWDYPYELHLKGGWLNPDSSEWFAEYARVCVGSFSDKVRYWMTLNEPQIFWGSGYLNGDFPPCYRLSTRDMVKVCHNALLSHGKAVKIIRDNAKLPPIIGFAPTGGCVAPRDLNDKDELEKARAASFDFDDIGFVYSNSYWGDPIVLGKYPEKAYDLFGYALDETVCDGDMEIISQPIDFYGANVYFSGSLAEDNGYGTNEYTGSPRTAMGWPITDDALYLSAKFLYERYHLPILITENGMANLDRISLDGAVHDPQRVDYVTRYLKGLKRAADEGAEIMGYLYWSIMDNFEWLEGYDKRFGLVYIDYPTQKRTIKDSGYWYKTVIEQNGENI